MSILGVVIEVIITPAAAFIGTMLGGILRSRLLNRPRDHDEFDTADELFVTGVLTSAVLAAIAAWLAGRGRTVSAFTGGLALGFVMNDRLDRRLFAAPPPEAGPAIPVV